MRRALLVVSLLASSRVLSKQTVTDCTSVQSCSDCMDSVQQSTSTTNSNSGGQSNANDTSDGGDCTWLEKAQLCLSSYDCANTVAQQSEYDRCCVSGDGCCDCASQNDCRHCGALNSTIALCNWDSSDEQCYSSEYSCEDHPSDCHYRPMMSECLYSAGLCKAYFAAKGTWIIGFLALTLVMVALPCCVYHKCGIDWNTEFKDKYTLNRGDGYVFSGGAPMTGRCMYSTYAFFALAFALSSLFGIIISASCAALKL